MWVNKLHLLPAVEGHLECSTLTPSFRAFDSDDDDDDDGFMLTQMTMMLTLKTYLPLGIERINLCR